MNIYLLGDFFMFIKILSIVFTIIFGTFFHFTYQLTNHNKIVGLFTATNESTFEHIKMALSARIFFIPIEIHFFKNYPNYYLSVLILEQYTYLHIISYRKYFNVLNNLINYY